MTPAEKRELVTELSTVLAGVIDRKLEPIGKRLDDLEGAKTKLGQGVRDARVEVTRSKHEIENSTNDTVLAAVRHLSGVVERIEQNSNRSLVKVVDEKGSTSIRPASLVAAESMVVNTAATLRTEGKTDATRVAADRADTQSLDAKKAAQRAFVTGIVTAVLLGIWHAYLAITHVAQ